MLEDYVAEGGMLVLPASSHRLKPGNYVYERNEDWSEANAVGGRFGVAFGGTPLSADSAVAASSHPLMSGVATLELAAGNALPVTAPAGQVLARAGSSSVVALVPAGSGEVLALGDLGVFGTARAEALNLGFWRNLARHAATRR